MLMQVGRDPRKSKRDAENSRSAEEKEEVDAMLSMASLKA